MSLQWDIRCHEHLGSTQDTLKALDGLGEGVVVQALSQNSGRGRHGRKWEAPAGNLYLSFLLTPKQNITAVGVISLLVGLAVYRAVEDFVEAPAALMLKWPNDVLLDGRKCAGILLESDIDADGIIERLYVGVGVNIASAPIGIAAALDDFSGGALDINAFRDALLGHVDALYTRFLGGDIRGTIDDWTRCAHAVGSDMSVKVGSNIQRGAFHGLDDCGNLTLFQGENRFTTITAGEVYLSAKD